MLQIDADRTSRARTLLAALPDGLFRSLPSADVTADICSHTVARALRSRNPRLVNEWLSYECSAPSPNDLLACLDVAIATQVSPNSDSRVIDFARQMRHEAQLRLSDAPAKEPVPHDDAAASVDGMMLAIGAYREELARHSEDVAALSVRIAKAAKLSDPQQTHIERVAKIHEIGRLRLPSDSAASFNDLERNDIRQKLGCVPILEKSPATKSLADTIYGLYVQEPLMASDASNIIRVADAFVSLMEPRPYRQHRLSPHEALAHLHENAERRFDARYVNELEKILGYAPHVYSRARTRVRRQVS